MIALLDVNVLIALFDAAHVHHKPAHAWMARNRSRGWATCPLTENGCVRVMSQTQYPGRLPVADVVRRLADAAAAPDHTFWEDSVSLCDGNRFQHDRILTPRYVTDIYLLALAEKNRGCLVSFDHTIPVAAVSHVKERNLVVL